MTAPLSLALGALAAALLSAVAALAADERPMLFRALVSPLFGLACALLLAAGLGGLLHPGVARATLPLGLPWLHWHLRLDALAAFFLALIGVVGLAVALYAPGYAREFEKRESLAVLGLFTGLFLTSMVLVVLADDAFAFMVAWELMSLASYFLVTFQHEHGANRRAGFLYLLMAEIGALAILLGFGVLAGLGDGFAFDAMRRAAVGGGWGTLAFVLAFFGFGMKAGLVPLHAWLPEAHPVAPSHVSALMSGVMLKVAVYGFIRFCFDLLGDMQISWGVAVLVVGAVSALLGVLYALMQHDLKRLLAYHSVENVGIIFIGLGLAMVFAGAGFPALAALGLVAALYHTINHALFKGLLFLGAGSVLHATHQRDMERMGGLLKLLPWTGLFFLVGCISISALPPFNGFVSEWLTFQAALQAWALENGILRSLIPVTAAMLALTGALAAACFVKVYGVTFLGQPRSTPARKAHEVSFGMRAGQGVLAAACLLLGVLPTFFTGLLDTVPGLLLGQHLPQATAGGWLWLTPVNAHTASYSAPLVFAALALAWWLAAWALRRGAVRQVRRCDAWDCGFSPLTPRMQYSATGFAQPIRRVFGPLFRIEESMSRDEEGLLRHRLQVHDRLWEWLYLPVGRAALRAGRWVGHLQGGNARIYLGWTLATLGALLWLIS